MTRTTILTIPNPELPEGLNAATQAIEALATTVAEARTLVEGGAILELVGLDDRVERLCSATASLRDRAALPALIRLTTDLDALEAALKQSHHAWHHRSGRLEPVTAPRRAAEAYGAVTNRPK